MTCLTNVSEHQCVEQDPRSTVQLLVRNRDRIAVPKYGSAIVSIILAQ